MIGTNRINNNKTLLTVLVPESPNANAQNYDGKKERLDRIIIILDKHTGQIMIDARAWMSYKADGMAPLYASIWFYGNPGGVHFYASGKGKASGCGYHKTSAAYCAAVKDAGFTVPDFAGVGGEATRQTFKAIAAALGYPDVYIVE